MLVTIEIMAATMVVMSIIYAEVQLLYGNT